jgi:hypothetical protein
MLPLGQMFYMPDLEVESYLCISPGQGMRSAHVSLKTVILSALAKRVFNKGIDSLNSSGQRLDCDTC